MQRLTGFWLALCVGLAPYTVLAGTYDGSVPLLCAGSVSNMLLAFSYRHAEFIAIHE
jgi:hypothetical protein